MIRGLDTTVRRIRRIVFEEVARLGFKANAETLLDDMETIPYKIVNEETMKYRESVYRARAIVRERLRLAMGLSLRPENKPVHLTSGVEASNISDKYYEPPLMQVIPSACEGCEEKGYEVSNMCKGCLAHPCMEVCPKGAISIPAGHVVSTELFARPAANCHLEHLWVAQGSGKPEDMIDQVSDGRVTLPLTGGMKVHAVFASDAVRVEVDENVAGGRISPDGSMVVSRAEQLALFFDADEGRCLREVVLTYPDGQGGFDEVRYDVPEGTYLYTLEGWELEEGMRISAVFGPGTRPEPSGGMFTIEPRVVGTGGAVSPAHAAVYAADMHPTFLLLPDAGYMVDELRVLAVAADGSEQLVEEMAGAEAASSYTFGTLTSDMRLEVSFTPIAFHTITFSWNVEGGTMDADGTIEGALSVLDGQEVAISVVPAEGYEVASVRYEPASEAPGLLDLLAGRAGGRDLEVPEEGGVVRFTATEDAHVTATFVERATEPGPGPDDGNEDGDEPADFFIEASAGAHGTISPSGRVGVRAGADIAFDLRPDAGYQVAFVEADGKRYAGHRSQWVLKGVSADHKLHVEFEPALPAGDNSEPARTIRRLQSLAQTSDALPIAALVLAAISCASAGAALIVRNRRRNERRADDER